MPPPGSRPCFRIVCPGSSFVISRKRTTRRRSRSRRCSRCSIGAARGRSCWWPSSIDPGPGWRLAAERRGEVVELTSQESRFVARVLVYPRAEVLDPQGRAIEDALGRIGFDGVRRIRAGKSFEVALEAEDERQATEAVDRMCRQLLANPIVEDYTVEWVSE
ncbi:MAG: phosphoribosylformylglycinamidine synthase subunit PurS [Holophagales bacterium]|nr:phosphoribosylformylglycinamidine synthase subunit PurS [Holophagales bacterium]MYJ24843.1 phosphoribosylformylglycinamidine synthase subunit PurS [Holophagales bacterium]